MHAHTYIHTYIVYSHTYIQMYMYVCLYMYVCICMHVYVCMYMYVCICMNVYVCVYVCVYMYVCMYVCMCMCVCVCGGNCPTPNVSIRNVLCLLKLCNHEELSGTVLFPAFEIVAIQSSDLCPQNLTKKSHIIHWPSPGPGVEDIISESQDIFNPVYAPLLLGNCLLLDVVHWWQERVCGNFTVIPAINSIINSFRELVGLITVFNLRV